MALHPKYAFLTILKISTKSKIRIPLNHIDQSKLLLHFKGLNEFSKPFIKYPYDQKPLLSVKYLLLMFLNVSTLNNRWQELQSFSISMYVKIFFVLTYSW
jgi:hypothetical protein